MVVIKILVDSFNNIRLYNPLQEGLDSTEEVPTTEVTDYTNASIKVDGYNVKIYQLADGQPLRQFIAGSETVFDIEYGADLGYNNIF